MHGNTRLGNEFNPGAGGRTRFAFFLRPPVPVLYAATTEEAAISESILHDVPAAGGQVRPRDYQGRVVSRLKTTTDLRLVSFHGLGLRQLGIEPRQLTDTESIHYDRTVQWAEAAHEFERQGRRAHGTSWMSRRCNSDKAVMLFGDRVPADALAIDASYGRAFDLPADLAWLSDFCAPLHIDVVG
ncbi:RES family NAD+ phosphorylase [Agromyces larvae]|uniref:RES family NAD+ phosphorylase n=1 Tax=Agromyces larvae TaxID=2929802 RepID=A0ABY4C490_9MICO|nr:RES family NAD+ phosphorylase [Agromyces larvae]UOE46144.1 RES family NAD+ phosphorylase [Agromyces larvae]